MGLRRQSIVDYMSNFVQGEQCVIDPTSVFSWSENVVAATLGHNSGGGFIPQLNIVLLTSVRGNHPSFFRIVPGSMGDVSTITTTVWGGRHFHYELLKRRIEIEQTLSSPFPSVQSLFSPAPLPLCQAVVK